MGADMATGFGGRLRELREAAGLTLAKLSELAGMHLQSLAKLEQGQREPNWTTVLALAAALGVTCEAFTGAGKVPSPKDRPRGRPAKAKRKAPVTGKSKPQRKGTGGRMQAKPQRKGEQ